MPKKTRRKGGRIIGKGAYGCVYKPAMRCSGETARRPGISKLLTKSEANAEWDQTQLLRNSLDRDMSFTVYPQSRCEPRLSPSREEETEDKASGSCDIPGANSLVISPDGGVTLEKWRPLNGREMEVALFNLFVGLLVLHTGDLVHQDIKEDNALVKEGRARWIDFGMMRNLNEMFQDKKGTARYTMKTGWPGFASSHLPPDSWMLHGNFDSGTVLMDPRMVRTAIVLHMRNHKDEALRIHSVDEPYLKLLETVYSWTVKNPGLAAKAVDVFQMGRLVSRVKDELSPAIWSGLRPLVDQMMDRDPRKRPTMFTALGAYSKVVKPAGAVPLQPAPTTAIPKRQVVANPLCGIRG